MAALVSLINGLSAFGTPVNGSFAPKATRSLIMVLILFVVLIFKCCSLPLDESRRMVLHPLMSLWLLWTDIIEPFLLLLVSVKFILTSFEG